MRFRPIGEHDLDALLDLNRAWVPAVGDIDRQRLAWLVAHACWARCTPQRDAFLIALPPGTGYGSRNYRWCEARWRDHAYIDRVAVAAHRQGDGVGRALYRALLHDLALGGVGRVTCEVNTRPPNPGSLAFHHRMGFVRTGVRADPDGGGVVAMLMRPVRPGDLAQRRECAAACCITVTASSPGARNTHHR